MTKNYLTYSQTHYMGLFFNTLLSVLLNIYQLLVCLLLYQLNTALF